MNYHHVYDDVYDDDDVCDVCDVYDDVFYDLYYLFDDKNDDENYGIFYFYTLLFMF